ncbi:MAG: glucosaminidase domain-containing protein [Candidatus Shapirobacteria bacterium]|nr:glucosaminidase domain-containing protein [Candidatus Shapirobacteria bacterium]
MPKSVQAQEIKLTMAGTSAILKNESDLALNEKNQRILQLETFLKKYNSPLSSYAKDFIETADKYQIDWKLVPAITGVESTFGRQIPYNSYNAYGWQNGGYRFNSWEESIEKVTKTLKEKYYSRGLDTPYKIGPIYAPPSKTWAGRVSMFMKQIENFQTSNSSSLSLTI